jgi:2-keto-3-deoxy-L-rhamnonate aldolase RhmA
MPRDPAADLGNVMQDLPPEVRAGIADLARKARDAHRLRGISVVDLQEVLREAASRLERTAELGPSNRA